MNKIEKINNIMLTAFFIAAATCATVCAMMLVGESFGFKWAFVTMIVCLSLIAAGLVKIAEKYYGWNFD